MKRKHLAAILAAAALPAFAFNYETLIKNAESTDGKAPIASIWQKDNEKALAAAVSEESIAAYTDSREAAMKLLSSVKPAYDTDPLDSFRIAEVTHWVMVDADSSWYEFWREHRGSNRRVWTEALIETASGASDDYVKIFCLDQLRWCAFPCQAEKVGLVGARGGKAVRDFAQMVVRELKGDRIGSAR